MAERRPRTVAFALLASLLLLTTAPGSVAASSHNESVASVHTTDSDFNAATELTNVSVLGTGADANVVLAEGGATFSDGFDDEPADTGMPEDWTAVLSPPTVEVTNSTDYEGGQSLLLGTNSAGDDARIRPSEQPIAATTENVSFAMRSTEGDPNVAGMYVYENGTRMGRLYQTDAGDLVWSGTTLTSAPTLGDWIHLTIADVDPAADTATVHWQIEGGTSGSQSVSLEADMTNGIDETQLVIFDTDADVASTMAYDSVQIGEPEPFPSGTYVSQTHDASAVTTGWTDLTLDNATASVEWLADTDGDGTFETTAASGSFATTANHTLDVSGTTADDWRVNVTFERTGAEPTAEVHDEGLLFQARDPTASNLDPDGTTITGDNDVQLSADVSDADFATAQGDSVTVEFTFDGSVVHTETVASNQTVATTVQDVTDGTYVWNVSLSDDYGGTTQSADATVTLDHHDPELTNPQPADGASITEFETNLSVDVADGDVPESWGDNVTVTFHDVNESAAIASETVSSNQTVEVTWSNLDLGSNFWNVTASDEYGNTAELAAMEVVTPSQLTVREEHDPPTIVNGTTLTIRFYTVDGEIAIQRTTTNGTLNMSGLPNSDFVVSIESDTHYTRRVYLNSIFEQADIFVLNSTTFSRSQDEAVSSRFEYTDLTGQFPRADTTVQVERALDVDGDGTSEFRTVAGDFWGAGGEFGVVLERNERYRLVVANRETGESMVLGTHVPTADRVYDVRTSGLVLSASNASGVYADAEFNESAGVIDVVYTDPADATGQLNVTVVPQAGGDPIFNDTVSGPLGTYTRTISLNSTQQTQDWIVEFESSRHRSAIPVGSGTIGLPVSVPSWLLTLLMTMTVTFVGALYGPRTALLGAWAMVFVAAGVAMFGWAFSGTSVVVAALVAIGATFVARGIL